MTKPLDIKLLAERWEREAVRIAAGGIDRLGVRRVDAATAAHCFTIAAALRASIERDGL